eukprot:1890283-Prymnesium_polylepis.2
MLLANCVRIPLVTAAGRSQRKASRCPATPPAHTGVRWSLRLALRTPARCLRARRRRSLHGWGRFGAASPPRARLGQTGPHTPTQTTPSSSWTSPRLAACDRAAAPSWT